MRTIPLLVICALTLIPVPVRANNVPLTHVSISPISELLIQMHPEAQATVVSLNDTLLSAEVSALIRHVPVRTGDRVNAGEVLMELDGWEIQAQLDQVRAALEEANVRYDQAKKQLERTRELHQRGQATDAQRDQHEAEFKTLEFQTTRLGAERKLMQLRLDKCRILAPFAGVVSERMAQVGAWAAPGTPLLRLVDTQNIELSAQIDAADAQHLTKGSELFFSDAGGRYPIVLRSLLPVQDTKSRTREARFTFAKDKPDPGSPGRVSWQSPIPYLPPHLMIHRKGELGIFLADQGVARFIPLPGALEGRPAPLLRKLDGDVIVTGREIIQDGEAVKVVPQRR